VSFADDEWLAAGGQIERMRGAIVFVEPQGVRDQPLTSKEFQDFGSAFTTELSPTTHNEVGL